MTKPQKIQVLDSDVDDWYLKEKSKRHSAKSTLKFLDQLRAKLLSHLIELTNFEILNFQEYH